MCIFLEGGVRWWEVDARAGRIKSYVSRTSKFNLGVRQDCQSAGDTWLDACGGECGRAAAAGEREVERAQESSPSWVTGKAGSCLLIVVSF